MEGNQARKFLRRVDSLEQTLMKESITTIIAGMPYVAALRAFDRVVVSCFGMELSGDYKQTISRFSKLYREIGISVTPKVRFLDVKEKKIKNFSLNRSTWLSHIFRTFWSLKEKLLDLDSGWSRAWSPCITISKSSGKDLNWTLTIQILVLN